MPDPLTPAELEEALRLADEFIDRWRGQMPYPEHVGNTHKIARALLAEHARADGFMREAEEQQMRWLKERDRVEELEAALREIDALDREGHSWEIAAEMGYIARSALSEPMEEKSEITKLRSQLRAERARADDAEAKLIRERSAKGG